MARGRELKVYLTSDVSKFTKGLRNAEGRMAKFKKAAAGALMGAAAAAGALAVKLGVDGVQAAIDDEASQARLAQALENTTGATEEQIAAMEDYISTAQEKTGLDDGEMRKGLARLIRSTQDQTRAQQIMNTAMEISIATGKPLGQVTEALAKFNDGNAGALKRLGITMGDASQGYADMLAAVKVLSKAEAEAARVREVYGAKSKEYAKAQQKVYEASQKINRIKNAGGTKWLAELNKQFDGSIAADAETYAGGLRRVQTAWDELLEAFGSGVIGGGTAPGQMNDLAAAMYDAQPAAEGLGQSLQDVAGAIASIAAAGYELKDSLEQNAALKLVFDSTGRMLGGPTMAVGGAIDAYNKWQNPTPNPYALYRPMRFATRKNDAEVRGSARAAQREARTRQQP